MTADELAQIQVEAELSLGIQAYDFLDTALGKYIVLSARQEIQGFANELMGADPTDSGKIASLQNEIQARRLLFSWLEIAINQGEDAAHKIQEQQDNE